MSDHDEQALKGAKKRARLAWMLPLIGIVLWFLLVVVLAETVGDEALGIVLWILGAFAVCGIFFTIRAWVYVFKYGAKGFIWHALAGTLVTGLVTAWLVGLIWLVDQVSQCGGPVGLVLIAFLAQRLTSRRSATEREVDAARS